MLRFLCILFVFLLPLSVQVQAEDGASAPHIAVVDVQQLMNLSDAAKSIQEQGKNLRDKYQKKIKKLEDGLKEEEQKLRKLPRDTSKEELEKKGKAFQEKLTKGQKEVRDLNQKLDVALKKALNVLRDKIVKIVGDLATDKKYDLVISRADVVIVSKDMDITKEIMKKLNKELSTVKVKD